MTREVKKAVTRIRRVQDAVYNNKLGICHSMSIHTNTLVRCDGEVMSWWTIFCHKEEDVERCQCWRLADDTEGDKMADTLKQIREYIGRGGKPPTAGTKGAPDKGSAFCQKETII